jgi:hypothetical protein
VCNKCAAEGCAGKRESMENIAMSDPQSPWKSPIVNCSPPAHIWHTKPDQKSAFLRVFKRLPLIKQINGTSSRDSIFDPFGPARRILIVNVLQGAHGIHAQPVVLIKTGFVWTRTRLRRRQI